MHCSFLPETDKLLELFKKKCRTKIKKNVGRRNVPSTSSAVVKKDEISAAMDLQETESVRTRHMGVLGLCAFVSAHPYDIPDCVPDIFEHLGANLNDPQPIPVSYFTHFT